MLEHERAERLAAETRAAESHASMRKEAEAAHKAELKRLRAAHAAEVRQLKADARVERISLDERITALQVEITRLERDANVTTARTTLEVEERQRVAAEAEAARLRDHGRAWQQARELQAQLERAHATRAEALEAAEELGRKLRARDAKQAAEHNELLALRARVKELREKVETYQARSNRRFFEVDPLQEDNAHLRAEVERLHRQVLSNAAEADALLAKEVAKARAAFDKQLAASEAERARLAEIAEPSKNRFYQSGHFSARVDLTIIECLQLGVTRRKVPNLFLVFARLYGIKLPRRTKKMRGGDVDGQRTTVEKTVLYVPGKSHIDDMAGVMNQLNKLQVGEWLTEHLESDETSCCYLADGAESQQIDYLGQLLARRVDGHLQIKALDLAALGSKTADAQAAAFRTSMAEMAALMEKAGKADARAAELLRKFTPTCAMNDRASPARAAARKVLGLADGDDDPTCAEHGAVNILEKGREAMDAVLREMMSISDEQAAGDASKIKAMRTCVGWFSSPACALIYQVAKYVALCSSKGYAIGQKFLEWIEARLADQEDQTGELLGHSEDMLAICGSRMYVFFLDAAPTERLISQAGSLLTYLEEEDDLGAEGGGRLRKSILTGANSEPCMAAVRAMAIICDAVLWPLLKAVKPSAEKHVLDVLPTVWPKTLRFFEDAAANPTGLLDGSLRLELGGAASPAAAASTVGLTRRAERARIDMARIRGKAAGDPLVARLLAAAAAAMATSTKNHASEWLPGGKLSAEVITPALRARYDALVSTSTSVERLHALGRCADDRGGMQRAESRAGVVLARHNDQAGWLQAKGTDDLQHMLDVCRGAARSMRALTIKAQRIAAGRAKRAERDAKLTSKRAKRLARAAELRRIEGLTVATKFSELVDMQNDALQDQLKYHKLVRKQTGFTVTQKNRVGYVLQLQGLLVTEHGEAANDLAEGDSGITGRGIKRKQRGEGSGGGGGSKKKQKQKKKIADDLGNEWEEEDQFKVEAIIGRKQEEKKVKKGGKQVKVVIWKYHVVWEGYPADASTWEPAEDIENSLIEEYEAELEAEAQLDAEEAAELEGDDEDDE